MEYCPTHLQVKMASFGKIGVVFVKPVTMVLLPTSKEELFEKMFEAIRENQKEVLGNILKEFPEQSRKEIVNGKFVYENQDLTEQETGKEY